MAHLAESQVVFKRSPRKLEDIFYEPFENFFLCFCTSYFETVVNQEYESIVALFDKYISKCKKERLNKHFSTFPIYPVISKYVTIISYYI